MKTQAINYNLSPGRVLAQKYEVLKRIGKGTEGEVYLVHEKGTDIERAAKLFFPNGNQNGKAARKYAQRLHRLKHCPSVIQYHGEETLTISRQSVTMLLSEYVEGESITDFVNRHPGKRLHPYQGLHLLYAISKGLSAIHKARDYHGDLHSDNILVSQAGLKFKLKFMDFYTRPGLNKREVMEDDIFLAIRIFYDALGGQAFYAKHPDFVKDICRGLKHNLIKKRFPNAAKLKTYLETVTC